jgi:hypothetical protein
MQQIVGDARQASALRKQRATELPQDVTLASPPSGHWNDLRTASIRGDRRIYCEGPARERGRGGLTMWKSWVFIVALAGCATAPAELPPPTLPRPTPAAFAFDSAPGDSIRPVIEADARVARAQIETFFGQPFRQPVSVLVAPNRAAFDAALPAAWGIAPSQCWMVGVGVADNLYLVSPTAWASDACEHDAADAQHVQDIVTHELVHAFHGQHNPSRDFANAEEVGWFVEGLAVYVAGQLDRGRSSNPAEAIAADAAPTRLAEAWSGRYRYGVCGSMVQYIDQTYGRATVIALLSATTQQQVLDRLGVSEADFLTAWRAWVEHARAA